jgi:hypothetical protein
MVTMLTGLKRMETSLSCNSGQRFFENPLPTFHFQVRLRWAAEAFFESMLLYKAYLFSFIPSPAQYPLSVHQPSYAHSIPRP